MRTTLCLVFIAWLAPSAVCADLDRLAADMTGSFSNLDQARGDQNYHGVSLHLSRIWVNRPDGPWLYGEQSLADAPEHPYRQYVYQLVRRPDAAIELRIFDLSDPIAMTNAWRDPARIDRTGPADLLARAGCTLILRAQPDGSFKGATEGRGCSSDLRGASYASSEATISDRAVITWDRGYNRDGVQVWGSIHGGYVFKRDE